MSVFLKKIFSFDTEPLGLQTSLHSLNPPLTSLSSCLHSSKCFGKWDP